MRVIPAYGRDYKSKAAVLADLRAGKDFLISDMSSSYDGRYLNLADLESEPDWFQLNVRYAKLTKVCVLTLKEARK